MRISSGSLGNNGKDLRKGGPLYSLFGIFILADRFLPFDWAGDMAPDGASMVTNCRMDSCWDIT
jgi:hypothetical protein